MSTSEIAEHGRGNLGDGAVAFDGFGAVFREDGDDVGFAVLRINDAGVVAVGGDFAGLVGDAGVFRQFCGDHAAEFLAEHDAEAFLAGFGGEEMFFEEQTMQADEAFGGDFVIDAGFMGALVFDAAFDFNAAGAGVFEDAADVIDADEIEQQIGREIAAADDHDFGELADGERAADGAMHGGVGVAITRDAIWASVDHASKSVADLKAIVEADATFFDGFQNAEQDAGFEGAGGVEESVAVIGEPEFGFVVVEGDGDGIEPCLVANLVDSSEKLRPWHALERRLGIVGILRKGWALG